MGIRGYGKGGVELEIFHSMLKYNDLSVVQNISGNDISFRGDCPLKLRTWILKIPRDKPLAWPDLKYLSNQIELQIRFSQEENCHVMWDTTGMKNLTTIRFPRLAVVPYAVVEWLNKKGHTPNELRIWLEKL